MTAKDSSAAVTVLRGQFNKIDVVITDYHMPGLKLNGVQLKQRIAEEFGNLPVIGMFVFFHLFAKLLILLYLF